MIAETSRGAVTVRKGMISDALKFRELRLDALQESPAAFPADYEAYANHPMRFWEDRLEPDGIGSIFFAVHNDQLVGMTGIRKGDTPKTKHSATIWGVYVRPAWRGLHLADSLIEKSIEWAKLNGVNIVKLGVLAASISAIRCYERCGFTVSGTEPRGIFYDGDYYDGFFMYRFLDDP